MKSIEIKATNRKETGKSSAKKYRAQGLVPCEIYGGKENVHILVDEKAFKKVIYTPNTFIVEFDVEGKKVKTLLKDAQFHPVSDNMLHADFIEVFDDKTVNTKIPVKITGNSVGVRNGGKLRLLKRALRVSALPKDLPDDLEIDITKLEIGGTIKIKDIKFTNLELIDPQNAVIVSVVSSRVAKMTDGTAEETATEGAEGETAEGAEQTATEGNAE